MESGTRASSCSSTGYCSPLTVTDFANRERPHQALDMAVFAARYARSARPYRGLADLTDPLHDWTATVTICGRVCFKNRKVNLSQVFAGQNVGVKQVSDRVWLVTFMQYDGLRLDYNALRDFTVALALRRPRLAPTTEFSRIVLSSRP